MRIARYVAISVVLVLSVITVACGSGYDSGETVTSTAVSGAPSSPADTPAGKLSANNASDEELEAAFEAAGISNEGQWAHEVEEYRPYSVDDTEFAKLRGELAKYNPGPGVVDAIVALLDLP